MKILVIDDDVMLLRVMSRILVNDVALALASVRAAAGPAAR